MTCIHFFSYQNDKFNFIEKIYNDRLEIDKNYEIKHKFKLILLILTKNIYFIKVNKN